ncbi:hypothetical protein V3C33_06000 [Micrococcaceae bacterium Sec5.7]
MSEDITPARTAGPKDPHDKSRTGFVDPGGSEATRELRGTARRRREAEEKLQLHLQEAKEHAAEQKHSEGSGDSPGRKVPSEPEIEPSRQQAS